MRILPWDIGVPVTCVVGWIEPSGRVCLIGDSAVTGSDIVWSTRTPKVWTLGRAVIGAAGDAGPVTAASQLRAPPDKHGADAWVKHLSQRVAGFGDLELLVGIDGRLFELDGTGAVDETGPYHAIGCATGAALVALDGLKKVTAPGVLRILARIAARFPGVRGPYNQKWTGTPKGTGPPI